MTDLERWKEFLSGFSIQFSVGKPQPDCFRSLPITDGEVAILLEAGSKKITGYTGFFAEVCFDEAGNFISVGVWE